MYSSQFNKQNELIRSLRKQLQAPERALADQKWLFQQFLNSPSWRMTFPIRWLAKQVRIVRDWLSGRKQPHQASSADLPTLDDLQENESVDTAPDLKQIFTDLYRIQLQSFISANGSLQLPHSDTPELSVLLVLFNRAEMTLACLRSLAENYSERMEIIIVDNASQDETPLLLDRLRGARIIRNTENRNFLLAVNQAAQQAHGEYLLLLNNDAQVLPGTLQSALSTIRSAPDIGAVGGRLILLDGALQEAGSIVWRDGSCLGYGRGDSPLAPMYMFRRDVDYCSGAFLLTRRRVWQELGGFDEIFKPAYYEETDYCTRLWERNLRVVYDPNAVVMHYEFASSAVSQATTLQREHQRVFASRHHKLLADRDAPDLNAILYARSRDRGKKRILFIDDRVPHSWLGSGFPRARAILLTLLENDHFVTLYPLSEFQEPWTSVYADIPPNVELMMGYGPMLLEPFLRNRPGYYDAIFISRPHNMQILKTVWDAHPEWFEKTSLIYDAEALFATREITFRQLAGTPLSEQDVASTIREEVRLASAADCVIAVSESDGEQFRKYGVENVEVVGHSLPACPTPREFNERNGFLFVGAIHEEASPNGDSVVWFLAEVLLKIQARLGSEIPVTIAGINRSDRVKQLAETAGSVRITGHLADLTSLYDQARVFIAPTRYAAGIPHKVHEAAARGLPIVTTPLLASQLDWHNENPVLVAADADSFAASCIRLHTDEALWARLRTAGLARIQTECSPETFEKRVVAGFKTRPRRSLTNVGMDR